LSFYAVAVWAAVTVNFAIPRLVPGNAVEAVIGQMSNVSPSEILVIKKQLGAAGAAGSGSLFHQYIQYWNDMIHFNLGTSVYDYPAKVTTVIGQTLPWTVGLVGVATIISFTAGTLLGVLAAWRRGGWLDRALPAFTFLQAMPYFFLALVLVYFFAVKLGGALPTQQAYALGITPGFNWTFIGNVLAHAILPAATIIITSIGGWMLQMRNVMLTTISEDYILVAQAKGLSSRRVMFTYGARNAILPNIAGFSLALGFVVAGAIVMEIVFSYPGVGFTLFQAVQQHDVPLMQGLFLVISLTVLTACLLADIAYVIADPRARTRGA